MRMLAVYHKGEAVRFVSHLDVQRTLHRAFRRAKMPLAYSAGFNPHPELSFASALPTGASSDCEWFEVELTEDMAPEQFLRAVNAALPGGFFLSDAQPMPEGVKTLSALTRAAEYRITALLDRPVTQQQAEEALSALLSGEIVVNKRTKSGVRPVDIRPQIMRASVEGIEGHALSLRVLGKLQADGGLRAELLMGALFDRLDASGSLRIHRSAMYFASDGSLPRIPLD